MKVSCATSSTSAGSRIRRESSRCSLRWYLDTSRPNACLSPRWTRSTSTWSISRSLMRGSLSGKSGQKPRQYNDAPWGRQNRSLEAETRGGQNSSYARVVLFMVARSRPCGIGRRGKQAHGVICSRALRSFARRPHVIQNYDVLILGSGTAGQSLALRLADHLRIALVTKRSLADSASAWAQGGIAAVLDATDSIEAHIEDTFTAGAGLCDPVATRFVVENSRRAIEWLIERGVPFTREDESAIGYHLTREGGHSHRRIIHAADATGAAVQATLGAQVRAHPNIDIFEHHIAIDLVLGDKIGHPELGC